MIKFIKLTNAFNGNEVVVNTNAIAYMQQDQSKNTVIYFISALNTERSCCLACVAVKETINEIQSLFM